MRIPDIIVTVGDDAKRSQEFLRWHMYVCLRVVIYDKWEDGVFRELYDVFWRTA